MDIVVRGRKCEVSDGFKRHVEDKLSRLERLDGQAMRIDVEITEEKNPKLADQAERVEITVYSRGPVIRSEAATADRYSALDIAASKVETRLRRANSRRHDYRKGAAEPARTIRHAGSTPRPVHALQTVQAQAPLHPDEPAADHPAAAALDEAGTVTAAGSVQVREKHHEAMPMSLDQALYEMELLGHDFFLFVDESEDQPSVVYRRKGYDYGVIRLTADGATAKE